MTTEPTKQPSSSDVPQGSQRPSAASGTPAGTPTETPTGAPTGRTKADDASRAAVPAKAPVTRAAVVWVAVAVALVILVLLIIFFIQNQDQVKVYFLGFEGSLALGIALFIAAVGGGILVAFAGGARIVQLRIQERRNRKRSRR
ncbi:DUF1049 domain-containing protein [Paenarthrobacter sp. Z7-10]|uniref:LapA family protein n=1 Tax=Paenarthrobacter sp. Z7-10 TaxID=2787635 RepID=UPI0022A92569|nr:lipopolysaccharide assembly protein LapA domain-containing protein [Paenarthrobacter sp. Z7-10]MCZ2402585.1 DUF1049 domain-containing protein [Paenarthrobacter sp. Z7-10]